MKRPIALAAILLLAFAADLVYGKFYAPREEPWPIRVPFAGFPMDLLGPGWRGEDIPLPKLTEEIAGVSDYIQRTYTDGDRKIWFYVGYTPGPPKGVHHPGICFPLSGLIPESEEVVTIPAPEIPKELRFKESRWRSQEGSPIYSLTTFYYRGKFEPLEFNLRKDRFLGIHFYAVITVSGPLLGSMEETRQVCHGIIRKAVPALLPHFPE